MRISAPFGYKEIVPFLKTQKVRLLAAGEVPEFIQRGNAVPISHSEFQPVARHYPIVFASGDAKTYAAVAVLGFTAGENLFCRDGKWKSGAYIPAYARRYPFCMARVNLNEVEQKDRLICVEKSAIDEAGGEAMFDAAGQPTEKWKAIERLLGEYEADLERAREMCATLAEYGLLEAFNMQATLTKERGGRSMQLTGMHRVVEQNLENLNAAQLKNLVRKGYLARIYMHLLSLQNFGRLLDRNGRTA
ncbi:MAG TPA: SapC family protein [Burkholderiales bacterium]|nr:SapC family protein [Burkholderiales bacterium]